MQIMANKYVTEKVEVVEQSKNSSVRVVLQAGIEKASEDPTTWDVEACERILAYLSMVNQRGRRRRRSQEAGCLEGMRVDLPQDQSVNLVMIFKEQFSFNVDCKPI